jgi:peptidoglycan/LPS O-acetylase OafA/YrhL
VVPAEPTARRSTAIFGIRGFAALALMTVHVAMFSGLFGTRAFGEPRPPSNFVGAFFVSGLPSFIGVFFVLPALFLYLPLAKAIISGKPRPPQRNTIIRRLVRLLPGYWFMCLVTMVLLNLGDIKDVWYVLRPFLLLQVYLPSPFTPHFMNGMEITWTVPSMVQWYLFLPMIAWATHRFARRGATPVQRARRLLLPVPILIAIGVGWLFFVKAQGWDNRILFWWPQGFAPTVGVGIGLAVLLALAQVSPADTPKLLRVGAARPGLFLAGAGVVYLVNCARPFSVIGMDAIYSVPGLLTTYLLVAAFGLFATLPLISPGARSRFAETVLGNRPVAFLGRISYGIYLWHFAVMHFYLQPGALLSTEVRPIREFYGTVGFLELEAVTFAGSVILATLSFYLVEQPIAALVDRRLKRRRPRVPTPAGLTGVPASGVLTGPGDGALITPMPAAEAATTTAAACRDRDAIRANLVDLEQALGDIRIGADLATGQTRRRSAEAQDDLARLWGLFSQYSTVIDEARRTADASRPVAGHAATLTWLLTGPAVVLTEDPPPLGERHITDDGRRARSIADTTELMNDIFRRLSDLVHAVRTVRREVPAAVQAVRAELNGAGGDLAGQVEAELARLERLAGTDPLALWDDGPALGPLTELRDRLATAGAAN